MREVKRKRDPGATAGTPRCKDTHRHDLATCRGDGVAVAHFRDVAGHDPWPWQRRLLERLVAGDVPPAIEIPTGCGKTASVLLALLARLGNASLPRRIVYIVDRRAIVDQTAATIRVWTDRMAALPALCRAFDASAAFSAERPVALGVLRGGLADDGAWRADPARPAVIVGTVDLVGSRLLFRGYGDGRSMRATHAGLLGHDALVVLDEAHLAPALETLLTTIGRLQGTGAFRTMTLSATGPARDRAHGLGTEDFACPALCRRLHAAKRLRFETAASPAGRIALMCGAALAHRTGAVAVFVERVEDAARIAARLTRALGPEGTRRVALLTGRLRGRERAALVEGAVWRRFDPGRDHTLSREAVYLVATAAGEVGVDLDADHAIADLTTLDAMIQRFGRVNRTGAGEATITVVCAERDAEAQRSQPETFAERRDAARRRTLEVLRALLDASPATLDAIDADTVAACTVSRIEPARLDAVMVEAFAATSARLPLPPVGVVLRGVGEAPEVPATHLAWRWDVPALVRLGPGAVRAVLAFHRPRPAELARVPTPFAARLIARALARRSDGGLPMVVVEADGAVRTAVVDDAAAAPALGYATVLLPPCAGGLTPGGLPDPEADDAVADVGDGDDRVRYVESPSENDAGAEVLPAWVRGATTLRIPFAQGDDTGTGERTLVYARRGPDPGGACAGLGWIGGAARTVDAHCAEVGAAARRIAAALGLDESLVEALATAGVWHDRGKARAVWQRAAGAPRGGPAVAKVRQGTFRPEWLGGYRHEFGSLADAERALGTCVPHRDLVLHLIAAHHGWARPGFPHARQWDPDDSGCANRARAVRAAERFARLQATHGPWRLAWLEVIVKAADARASLGTQG